MGCGDRKPAIQRRENLRQVGTTVEIILCMVFIIDNRGHAT